MQGVSRRVSGGIEWNRKPRDLDGDENELDELCASQREKNTEIYIAYV